MKRITRILLLAVTLVTGLTTVSAQTVQVLVRQRARALPTTATNYLDDPFRYFDVQFNVIGAGAAGIDIFYDMDFTITTSDYYIRTKPGSLPKEAIHLNEGVNLMKRDVLLTQLRNGRLETNIDFKSPIKAQQMPEGTYQLCMDIYLFDDKDRTNKISTDGPCNSFELCYSGSAPELVSPMAGSQMALNGAMVVKPTRRVNFFWTPVVSNCANNTTRFKYMLKVVKVMRGQNYTDAVKYNPPVFTTEVRNVNYAVFDTLRDVKVQLEKGSLYVAQVKAEPIKGKNTTEAFIIANDGNSQPMPFFWGFAGGSLEEMELFADEYGYDDYGKDVYDKDDDLEENDETEGIDGLTHWEGGAEEVSELETIVDEMQEPEITGFGSKRHYVESDGYYTIPMSDNIEVGLQPVQHKSLKNITYTIALYDYKDGDIDSITASKPLRSEKLEKLPESRTLNGWGTSLKQGDLYYLELSSSFEVGYWKYVVADTLYYVNDMLAEHFHDTISREFVEEELVQSNGVFFQWGDDPKAPAFTTPQWKAPVDRSGDDIYDPVNYVLPTAVPEVQKAKTFPVSWTSVKNVAKGDVVEYEVNVYELKPGQTLEEAVSENKVLVNRTLTNANAISESDTKFFKVFSPGKTYVMTLSTSVSGDSDVTYHFENGNEALPIVIKIAK